MQAKERRRSVRELAQCRPVAEVSVDAGDLPPELLLSVRVGNLRRQASDRDFVEKGERV